MVYVILQFQKRCPTCPAAESIVSQVPQHFSIPVLGADEQPSASLTPAALPPTKPAELEEAEMAEAPKPVLAASVHPSSIVNEPFPDVVAALLEYKQKDEEAIQAGGSASSAASLPSAVADPANDAHAPATAEVCSQPHLPLLPIKSNSVLQIGTANAVAAEHCFRRSDLDCCVCFRLSLLV